MTVAVVNFIPTPDGYFADPRTEISFDLYDTGGLPVDTGTISVYLSDDKTVGSGAVIGGIFQDGYTGSITDSTTDGYDGKTVTIIPSAYMYNNIVAVRVEANTIPAVSQDAHIFMFGTTHYFAISSREQYVSISPSAITVAPTQSLGVLFANRNFNLLYQQSATGAPVITSRNPPVNGFDINRETSITFALHDSGQEGVDIGSLMAYINGELVISHGFFVSPNTGSINSTTIDTFAGYLVTISAATEFDFSETIAVHVIVNDLVDDPAAVNVLDTTYYFTIEPYYDVTGPTSDPITPPTGVSLDACIEFDWLDNPFGDYPDFFTLNVTFVRELQADCITDRREDVAVVNGVAAPGYELFATPIEIGDQKGYHVKICPDVPFSELEVVTVVINGKDSLGNPGSTTFEFSTVELTPPTILNLTPEADQTDVDPETSIVFEVHDQGGTGVDISRLSANVDNGEALIDGGFIEPYSGTIVNTRVIDQYGLDFDGYRVTIDRSIPYDPGSDINVEISAYDAYGNLATLTYDFTISPDIIPPRFVFEPESGTTGVSRDTIITVDVLDVIGVDTSSVKIQINGQYAVSDGVAVSPFDVTVSFITSYPGVVDGYRYAIDTENDFGFNTNVTTTVSAQDTTGNYSSASSTFRTFADIEPPTLTSITPRDGQLEVSLRPEITFVARDAYDVAFELTTVTVGGEPAITAGVVQPGFSMDLARIDGGILGVNPGDGYAVILTPDADFGYNQTVDVDIKVYDRSQNNLAHGEVSWITVDPAAPAFDIIPGPGDLDVPVDTNIYFEVFSDGYKVDISTLNVYLDGIPAIVGNVVQEPNFIGTVTTIVDGYHYVGQIDPRYLLEGDIGHGLYISAEEPLSGNLGVLSFVFYTAPDATNPKTLYIGDANGVKSIQTSDFYGNSTASVETLFDGYYVNSIENAVLNYIHRLVVSTKDSGAIFYSTNYDWPTLFYSIGDEIIRAAITTQNNGTIYLANRTRERIDVYYNILADDIGRYQPDVYYSVDGYALPGMFDGYFTDMVVTEGTSTINSGSNSIFIGTSNGVFRIETDESVPGNTEINGSLTSYGIPGGPHEYRVLEGTTNEIVAIDVNTKTNHIYVATRSPDTHDQNAVSYIDLATNTRSSFIPEARLINRLVNDITFKNRM